MSFNRIKGVLLQNLFFLRHSFEDIIDTFFWPTIDIIIWGFMTTYFISLRGSVASVISFLLGGLILWNIAWRAQQDISFALLRNVWARNILSLFASPLAPSEFIVATIIFGFFKIILTVSFVSAIAFILYHFNIFSLGFYLLPFFINLIVFAWVAGIFITGLIIRFGMRIQSFAWSLIILLQPISAVFYPVSILPVFLQKIAFFLPTAHIFEGMRQVLNTGKMSPEHIIWATIFNIIYLIISSLFFSFMFEKAREKGKLAKAEM